MTGMRANESVELAKLPAKLWNLGSYTERRHSRLISVYANRLNIDSMPSFSISL